MEKPILTDLPPAAIDSINKLYKAEEDRPKPIYEPSPAFKKWMQDYVRFKVFGPRLKPGFNENLLHFPSYYAMVSALQSGEKYGPNRTRN